MIPISAKNKFSPLQMKLVIFGLLLRLLITSDPIPLLDPIIYSLSIFVDLVQLNETEEENDILMLRVSNPMEEYILRALPALRKSF